ncbi:type III PLP-dependent enzyme [Marinobacter alexandrii]|uniref:type III PLP-dependent enzyme n=1 Tax=Marinobacter alexandrii TaxID=2570351 RepID=UPI001487378F|nr:type III PLP-dependent enzyme [Marinobacter alexandrii]
MSDIPGSVQRSVYDLQAQGTDPLCAYIYDLGGLRHHVSEIAQALPANCEMFYATKANPALPVLQAMAPLVHGFEVASGGELDWVRSHFPDIPVIFGGPGKLESELDNALSQRVELIHVESLLELRRLCNLADHRKKPQDILLRINLALEETPSTRLTMGGIPTPFGMEERCITEALAILSKQDWVRIRGFHFHMMSHQLDGHRHLTLIERYLDTVRTWEHQFGLTVDQINVGGGIGVNYLEPTRQFDWIDFFAGLKELLERYHDRPWRIRFECGRALTAACGYYAAEVLDIKSCGNEWFAICRGGTHHFRTPAAQAHDHPFRILSNVDDSNDVPRLVDEPVTLVGQLCTPKDVFARQIHVPSLSVGDLVVFQYAGAYAWNISHQEFLMHPHPKELFID